MFFWLLISSIFSSNPSIACNSNNPNFYLKKSLTNNHQYTDVMANQNISTFLNTQECECDPKKGLSFSLPSFIKKDPKRESHKQFVKYQIKFSSADLEFYDEHGQKHVTTLGFTADNKMTAIGGVNFLMDIKKADGSVGCKNILTPKEKKVIRDCSARVEMARKDKQGNLEAVMKSCEIKVAETRKRQNLKRKKLTQECVKNSREVKSFAQLQQEMINKSKFSNTDKPNSAEDNGDEPKRLGLSVTLKSLGENLFALNDNDLIISYDNEVSVKESGAIYLNTTADLVSIDNNFYLAVNNRVTRKINGQIDTRTTLSGGTGTKNALLTGSVTASKKGDDRTRLSATIRAGYEGKMPSLRIPGLTQAAPRPSRITFNGFLTGNDDNEVNFGASGQNKSTGTVYSLKRNLSDIEADGPTSVYASVQKPLNLGITGVQNVALSTVIKHTKDSNGEEDVQAYIAISGVTF